MDRQEPCRYTETTQLKMYDDRQPVNESRHRQSRNQLIVLQEYHRYLCQRRPTSSGQHRYYIGRHEPHVSLSVFREMLRVATGFHPGPRTLRHYARHNILHPAIAKLIMETIYRQYGWAAIRRQSHRVQYVVPVAWVKPVHSTLLNANLKPAAGMERIKDLHSYLAKHALFGRPISLKVLSTALNMPRTTVLRLLERLEEEEIYDVLTTHYGTCIQVVGQLPPYLQLEPCDQSTIQENKEEAHAQYHVSAN